MDENERLDKEYSIVKYFEDEIRRQLREGGIPAEAVSTGISYLCSGWTLRFNLEIDKIPDEALDGW